MIPNIENYMIEVFLLLALAVMSWIDIKHREFPAPLTSGILFLVAITNLPHLHFGILAFILAIFLLEMETFSGMADVKLLTAMGFIIPNIGTFLLFVIILLIFSTVYQVLMVKFLNKKRGDDFAYIPVLLLVYITLLIIIFI